jgi:DNA-binding MurR/RpiR family transcriptional regulator
VPLDRGWYTPTVDVAARIGELSGSLTRSERLVAEVVLARPQLVAFGTVADLASAAGAGAATVVRLAAKLGFDGFTGLQASVRDNLGRQLRPAAERIREQSGGPLVEQLSAVERSNVQSSLSGVDAATLDIAARRLADQTARVLVLSGDASRGVAQQFAGDLGVLRDDVVLVDGNEIAVARHLALLRSTDVLVVLDLRRYERWVVDAARTAAAAGVWSVALTDSVLSPLAAVADATFVISAASSGPFDSHVGTLAVFNLLVAAVAEQLREVATTRLDRLEAVWRQSFTDQ